jgi:hypothetical protein
METAKDALEMRRLSRNIRSLWPTACSLLNFDSTGARITRKEREKKALQKY